MTVNPTAYFVRGSFPPLVPKLHDGVAGVRLPQRASESSGDGIGRQEPALRPTALRPRVVLW